jgi:hypothetical protein
MERRLGRIQASHSQVNDLYKVALRDTHDGIRLHWEIKQDRKVWRELREGPYMLRTNLQAGTAEELWSQYVQLTEAEASFRTLKSEQYIRPLFHQLEPRVKTHVVCGPAWTVVWQVVSRGAKASCCTRDDGGPLGAVLSERASNRRELLRSNAAVVNVTVKRREQTRHVRIRETNANPEMPATSGKNTADTCLLAVRRPVYRSRDSNSGSRSELENLVGDDAKGKGGTSGSPVRSKVPMPRPGADCSVVVMNRVNSRGAKGAGHPRRDRNGPTGNRRSPLVLKVAVFDGWHEP